MNNGCTAMVGNTENMHPANTIIVCYNGSVGETFYQDRPFLASDDINSPNWSEVKHRLNTSLERREIKDMSIPVLDKTLESESITEDQLMRMMENAMRNSLEHGIDPRDNDLIPAEESFKGLFF